MVAATLEVGALILLIGAQVIAELERNAAAGLPWHADESASAAAPGDADVPAAMKPTLTGASLEVRSAREKARVR